MASRQQIKRRIGSVKSTKQITRAMQMVAASKLRRAQEAAVGPREYARLAREILTHLRTLKNEASKESLLFTEQPIEHRLVIVIASNRGLAGAYNSNVIRQMIKELQQDKTAGVATQLITVGRKASAAAGRISGTTVAASYEELPDQPSSTDLRPILRSAVDTFVAGDIQAVDVIFTEFVSSIRQEVRVRRLLPAGFDEIEVPAEIKSAVIEPSVDELLEAATVRLLEAQYAHARHEKRHGQRQRYRRRSDAGVQHGAPGGDHAGVGRN
jgi:F-type H+-transporting ATPase subunit gamma